MSVSGSRGGNNGLAPSLGKDGKNQPAASHQKRPASSNVKERGKTSGKKTRWGSDDDRVPYEQIMLYQSVNQLGIHLPNVALGLVVQKQLQQQQHILLQQCIANMELYNEIHGSPNDSRKDNKIKDKEKQDFTKDVEEDEILAQVMLI